MTEPTKDQAIQLGAVLQWKLAQTELQSAKALESDLRVRAIAVVFPEGLGFGTTNRELHDGSTLSAVVRKNAKVEQKKIHGALARLKRLGEIGALLALRLVKFRAEASIAEFDKLTPAQRKLFAGVITIEPAAASLELTAAT
jgi:hypothetical protein